MLTTKVVFGDSRKLSLVDDSSVQLIITSPPYWQLKDYGKDQIGFHDSYEEYINNLNLVWKECFRVLSPGCRLCINIGDQFARSVYYGRYKVIPIRTEIIRFCETLGMDYMGAVIWQKATTMNTTGGGAVMGSFPYPRNGILKMDYEFILLFKKLGDAPKVSYEQKQQSAMTNEEWNKYFSSHWNFSGAKQDGHIAMFPEELPHRLIKMFSFKGETVLDPFLGSGTTSLAAKNLKRNSVGYEINASFRPVIQEKVTGTTPHELQFLYDNNAVIPPLDTLPYIFSDPHKLNKKCDMKKLNFGSKIDGTEKERQESFIVKEILTPETLLLENDVKIKLIGIRTKKGRENEAKEFLRKKTNKHKVIMKFDKSKYDENQNLQCYLYLENKTFLNAHLARSGYVDIDITNDYIHRDKFSKLQAESEGQ